MSVIEKKSQLASEIKSDFENYWSWKACNNLLLRNRVGGGGVWKGGERDRYAYTQGKEESVIEIVGSETPHKKERKKKREIIRKGGHFARGNLELFLDDDDVRY